MKGKFIISGIAVIFLCISAALCAYTVSINKSFPSSVDVNFSYDFGSTAQTLKVNFDTNSPCDDYSSLSEPAAELSCVDLGDYELPSSLCVYDDNPDYAYVFGGWFTSAQGGEKVEDLTTFSGQAEVTLYAQWKSKAILTVTLQDLNYNLYNIDFTLDCGGEVRTLQTSGTQTLDGVYYLNPWGGWKITVTARTTVEISSEDTAAEEGEEYSYTALINASGIQNLPSALTRITGE